MKKRVIVNGNLWEGDERYVKNCLRIAKEKFSNDNANAIYAIEKDNTVEMKRDIFPEAKKMNAEIKEYKQKGFKVYSVKRR